MTDRNIEDIYPLSPMQAGMLFHALMAPGEETYVEQTRATLRGELSVDAFRQAWQRVVDRNAILRTSFVWEEVEEPLQVAHRRIELPLPVEDLRALPPAEAAQRVDEFSREDRRRGFDLGAAPLLRLALFRTADDAWDLIWTHHHILLDGWSLPILLREVFTFYESFSKAGSGGAAPPLPATRPYRDYIRYLKGLDDSAAERFWRTALAGYEGPAPLGLARAASPAAPRERNRERGLWLTPEVTAALQELGRSRQLTLNSLTGAAWALMLGRYSRSNDIVFGSTVSGRPAALRGAEGMVGLFINTLPVRARIDDDRPLGEWLADFQAAQAEARQYEHTPLVRIQGWSDVPRDAPLFDTLLVFENYPTDKALAQQLNPRSGGSLRLQGVKSFEQTNYALTFVAGVATALMLKISYDPALYDDATVERMLGHLATLLEAMPANLARPVAALPMLTAAEQARILQEWNRPVVDPPTRRISDLVAEQAGRTPDAPAAIWEGVRPNANEGHPERSGLPQPGAQSKDAPRLRTDAAETHSLSYRELNRRANRLAHRLRELGAGPGKIVGLFMERSPALLTALLGVMKSGAAYMPLDPAYPAERIAYMVEDSAAVLILAQERLRPALPDAAIPVLCLGDSSQNDAWLDGEWDGDDEPGRVGSPDDPVYVIYTSGSTGAPKGVLVPHRALSNHAPEMVRQYDLAAGDRMLQFINPGFDAAGEQFWLPLICGAAVVFPGEERERLGEPLAAFCERQAVTHLHFPAPVWHHWCDDLAAAARALNAPVKTLVVGGEAPSPDRLTAWNGLLPAPCLFVNAYGPTEATVTATAHAASSAGPYPPAYPIGKPIANVVCRVVDDHMRWMPEGAPGELLIGGAGLALGYLNRPELTAERFVELPLEDPLPLQSVSDSSAPSVAKTVTRFYRTGDLVRWLADGSLMFAGRSDDQVKIRGYRVEPGEVEAAIAALPGVAQAAVVARKSDGVAARLVAYIAPESVDVAALRDALAARLPDYMMPAAWVTLPAIPLSANGKVDRQALLRVAPPDLQDAAAERREPSTPDEQVLAGLFSALLGVERVAATDSFFELGGHSLLATRLASRIREVFDVEAPLREIFEHPTVAGMAQIVAAARGDAAVSVAVPPIQPLPRGADGLPLEPPPLSFGQQRLWFLDQLGQGADGAPLLSYNTPAAIRMEGDLDLAALGFAVNEIARRHEVLRTTFGVRGGEPVQVIAPEQTIDLNLEDLSGIADAPEREAEALRRATAEVRRPFDLTTGPLLRVRIFRLAERDHLAVLTAHHIAADGWSLGILIGELAALYEAHARGELSSPLAPLSIQYADYAAWQRASLAGGVAHVASLPTSPLQTQLDYWKQQLAGLPARLDLPTDRPRPPVQTSNGSSHSFSLSAEQQRGLNALAKREGATLYMVLLAAYQTLLSRYSGQSDIAVGSVVASRNRPELEGLIGFFVNTLVFRTKFDGAPSFREVVARARDAALGAYAHQDVPFEMLVDAVQPRREMSHTPLFQAALSLQNLPMAARPLPGLTLRSVEMDRGTAQFDMLLSFTELDNAGIGATWEYNTDLFDRATIERMARNLGCLIDAALAGPDQPVAALPILAPEERALVLDVWNRTTTPFPDDTTIHALVAEWAVRTPDAPAVEFAGGESLTYAELDSRANRLARHLAALDVAPGALVGLSVERSLDMVVGILGILKAGAAYLPLDPNYPAERLAFMLEDSGIAVLLTQSAVLPRLPVAAGSDIRAVCLDTDWPKIAAQPAAASAVLAGPDSLAYCIYTSGSTGRPKGALLAHRGLCNLADEQARRFDMRAGKRVLQFSAFSFDASVWETVMALRSGATLVLAPQETLASGPELLRLLQSARITTVTLPPSLLAVLSPSELPDLDTVIAAGERCTNEIVMQWASSRKFFNAYGPTETTVCATMRLCHAEEEWPFGGPPIGGPIANFQCYVVDPAAGAILQPQPIGVPGELIIGGVGVAKGYLNRPELTAERFIGIEDRRLKIEIAPRGRNLQSSIFNPQSTSTAGGRLYRTGDLVRWLPTGELEFIGRIDDQVKVRGFRIELGEIEAALREHDAVREAVVAVRSDMLVAYYIPAVETAPASAELRAFLRMRLPEYMTPGAFVALEAFPLSPAGKVDRRALPAPDASRREAAAAYIAPRSETEAALAAMCEDLLAVERIGMDDNFFELGGHSLLATKLIARIRDAYQVELPLRALFEKPTVAGLAEAVDLAKATPQPSVSAAPAITARSREGRRVSRSAIDGGEGGAR